MGAWLHQIVVEIFQPVCIYADTCAVESFPSVCIHVRTCALFIDMQRQITSTLIGVFQYCFFANVLRCFDPVCMRCFDVLVQAFYTLARGCHGFASSRVNAVPGASE